LYTLRRAERWHRRRREFPEQTFGLAVPSAFTPNFEKFF
jgi:hypothetical protein